MNNMNQKKEWATPELTAIVKCRPEESVLFACKGNANPCINEHGNPTESLAGS